MLLQTWKLRMEERLLDIVDPELTEYPNDEVTRFIKIALFCTQAAAKHRPSMKQVLEMLSKDVVLNDKALTEPGLYRARSSQRSAGSKDAASGSSEEISSQQNKGKKAVHPPPTIDSSPSITQMLPRWCIDHFFLSFHPSSFVEQYVGSIRKSFCLLLQACILVTTFL